MVKFLENTSRLRLLHIQKYPSNCVLDSTKRNKQRSRTKTGM